MDWFEKLTGFRETDYASTRQKLEVVGQTLRSRVNGKNYGIGTLELVSLKELRERVQAAPVLPGQLKVSVVRGDVGAMHGLAENAGALFQVASQFNLLEMTGPEVTPEHGVTRYKDDPTQGPACAIAAGAATIYRNYFFDVDGQTGQTKDRQLDGLGDLGTALSDRLNQPVHTLWAMRNGYALCTGGGLDAISSLLESSTPQETDALREKLRIGVHSQVQVTAPLVTQQQRVSQAFCSALPVAYGDRRILKAQWQAFATLILEAAYEATLWAAVLNARQTGSNIVFLTRLGGGAFGNESDWITSAMRRAFQLAADTGLDVRVVSYGAPSQETLDLADDFAA